MNFRNKFLRTLLHLLIQSTIINVLIVYLTLCMKDGPRSQKKKLCWEITRLNKLTLAVRASFSN